MPRGVQISDEIRAQVIAELLTGASVGVTAKKYNLGRETVRRLRHEIAPEKLGQVGADYHELVNDVLLDCVSRHVEALNRFVEHVCSENYLQAKEPASLAKLYEAIANTPLSILQAASAAEFDDDGEAEA